MAKVWYEQHGQEYNEIHLLAVQNHARAIYDGMGMPWKVICEREGEYDLEINFDVSKGISDQ